MLVVRRQCPPLEPLPEVPLPTLRQRGHSQGTPQRSHIIIRPALRDIQSRDLRNRDAIRIARNHLDLITGADFSLAGDGEVETRPSAQPETA